MRNHLGRRPLAATVTSIIATVLATIALLADAADAAVVARGAIHDLTVPPTTRPGPRSTEVLDRRSAD